MWTQSWSGELAHALDWRNRAGGWTGEIAPEMRDRRAAERKKILRRRNCFPIHTKDRIKEVPVTVLQMKRRLATIAANHKSTMSIGNQDNQTNKELSCLFKGSPPRVHVHSHI